MTTSLVQLRCASLRSKSAYAAFGDFHEEHSELMGATTTYWCLKTMSKAGPDEHYVHVRFARKDDPAGKAATGEKRISRQFSTS